MWELVKAISPIALFIVSMGTGVIMYFVKDKIKVFSDTLDSLSESTIKNKERLAEQDKDLAVLKAEKVSRTELREDIEKLERNFTTQLKEMKSDNEKAFGHVQREMDKNFQNMQNLLNEIVKKL